jgi:DMSO/TMAO reductase YedYZ molybdopterin-dependent catalytic subunit
MKFGACFIVALWAGASCALLFPTKSCGSPLPPGITIEGPAETETTLTLAQIAAMPVLTETVTFGTDHGMLQASFSGPLLWTVLKAGGAVGGKMSKAVVREYALVTGSDGYQAVLALGEVSPAFEDKDVILATQMNGKALGPGHDRLVVPGEQRGGRSVRDVVSIAVVQAGSNRN